MNLITGFFPKKRVRLLFIFLLFLLLLDCVFLYIFLRPQNDDTSITGTADKIYSSCVAFDGTKEACYANQFYTLTKETDINFAKKVLSALQDIDLQNAGGCHFVAHSIASAEVEKNPAKWLSILREQNPQYCSGGFMHGVLETHMATDNSFSIDSSQFPIICDQVKDRNRFGELSCQHNLGHLLLVENDGDITESIDICSNVLDDYGRYACLTGVFMENITRRNLLEHKIVEPEPWNDETIQTKEEICKSYRGDVAKACWQEMSYMYIAKHNGDPSKLYEECVSIDDKESQNQCYIYGAGNLVNFSNFVSDNLPNMCLPYRKEELLYDRCMRQIIGSMMSSSLSYGERINLLCQESLPWYKMSCYEVVFHEIGKTDLPPNEKAKFCNHFSQEQRDKCIRSTEESSNRMSEKAV